jgi:hypothetical protein
VRGVTAQVYENGRRLAIGAGATSVHWIGGEAFVALSNGAIFVAAQEGETRRITAHDGVILSATLHPDGKRLVTGGDDGAIKVVSPDGETTTLGEVRKWVDHLVSNAASGVIVASVGKDAIVFKADKEAHRFTHPSTIGGVALDGKGRRLAVSHYGGVTMRLVLAADDKGNALKWAGSHLAITQSPEGEYVITGMQENALHGWRLPEKTDLRMDGYPSKTKSFSWDKRGAGSPRQAPMPQSSGRLSASSARKANHRCSLANAATRSSPPLRFIPAKTSSPSATQMAPLSWCVSRTISAWSWMRRAKARSARLPGRPTANRSPSPTRPAAALSSAFDQRVSHASHTATSAMPIARVRRTVTAPRERASTAPACAAPTTMRLCTKKLIARCSEPRIRACTQTGA